MVCAKFHNLAVRICTPRINVTWSLCVCVLVCMSDQPSAVYMCGGGGAQLVVFFVVYSVYPCISDAFFAAAAISAPLQSPRSKCAISTPATWATRKNHRSSLVSSRTRPARARESAQFWVALWRTRNFIRTHQWSVIKRVYTYTNILSYDLHLTEKNMYRAGGGGGGGTEVCWRRNDARSARCAARSVSSEFFSMKTPVALVCTLATRNKTRRDTEPRARKHSRCVVMRAPRPDWSEVQICGTVLMRYRLLGCARSRVDNIRGFSSAITGWFGVRAFFDCIKYTP